MSYTIRNKLSKLLKQHYPDIDFKFIFINSFTVGSFFKSKDSLPKHLISNVVYNFSCSRCNSRYVGETHRNLTLRFAEHRGVSARSGKPISSPSLSSIRQHSQLTGHEFDIDDFTILSIAKSQYDTKLLEALFVKYLEPNLNTQIASCQLNIVC